MVFATGPDFKLTKEIDGAAEQRGRPVVAIRRAPRDESGARTGLRQRDRRRQPDRSAADHRDVVDARYRSRIVHDLTIKVCGTVFNPASFDQWFRSICAADGRNAESAIPADF